MAVKATAPLGDFDVCPNEDCGHLGAEHNGGVDSPMVCQVEGCTCVLQIQE